MWRPDFTPSRELFPFESRFFESRRAGRIHYVDEGPRGGPATLLFLHGNPTWSFLWRDVIRGLRDDVRCVALDYPGFGLSDRPDGYGYTPEEHARVVGELVRQLDLRDMVVVGQDWGGPIGMRLALDERPRVRALVMGNTWYWPADAFHMRAFSRVMSSRLFQWLILRWNFFVRPLMHLATRNEIPAPVMDHYRKVMPVREARVGVAELPRQIRASSFWLGEVAHAAPRMLRDLPLLLVWGEADFAFKPSFVDRFRADFRNVSVEMLEAKHYIQEDAPEAIVRAIRVFLELPGDEAELPGDEAELSGDEAEGDAGKAGPQQG